ncbi:IS1 family transposase [Chlorogloea sp. CCALA 695]|uniref:IS1 family transposase n=1 Tax=Chlorogloea sp. CCALA 695 TaxID=2107693 RepID=UPI0018EDDB81
MSQDQLNCPKCGSEKIVKNGFIHNGNQNHKCRDCKAPICANPPQSSSYRR